MNQLAPLRPQRVAVIGGGIAGLSCALLLDAQCDVTLFEREDRLGGHSNTLEVDYDGTRIAVDTGFIVYNEPNYPNLKALFALLGVPTQPSDMSFAVSVADGRREWSGSSLNTLFGQRSNLLRPGFHRMWLDILRFNREAPRDWAAGRLADMSLGEYIAAGRYSEAFCHDYLVPMGSAIWSSPLGEMLAFPAGTFVRFFMNHGLLSVDDRPQWRTVVGGSREYVRRIAERLGTTVRCGAPVVAVQRDAEGPTVLTADGAQGRFDQVVFATHADQALDLLGSGADDHERSVLSAFRFQPNEAVLHRDAALMPRRRRVWASWNYQTEARRDMGRRVGLTYWMNRLQSIPQQWPLFVSLNPLHEPDHRKVFARVQYEHPLFDAGAIAAQRALPSIQGRRGAWYAGAWSGYGFHEDGLAAGIAVAEALGARRPWPVPAARHGVEFAPPPVRSLADMLP
jgi:predicted NAD/FAD-binding protein